MTNLQENAIEVSIIIPVFNTSRYLRQCIESARKQSLGELQILIVDDASTDDSLDIIREYEAIDPRIEVLAFPENRGPGAARNAAIKQARGRYIMFLDSDDWLEFDAVERLCKKVAEQNFKLVIFGHFWHPFGDTFNGGTQQKPVVKMPRVDDGEREILRYLLSQRKEVTFMSVSYFYERATLLEHQVLFAEDIFFEDVIFVGKAVFTCDRIGVLKQALYHYRYRMDSTMQSVSKKKIYDRHTAILLLKEFLEQKGVFHHYENEYLLFYIIFAVCGTHYNYIRLPKREIDQALERHMRELREGDALSDANLSMLRQKTAELGDDEIDTKNLYTWANQTATSLRHDYTFFLYKSTAIAKLIELWLAARGALQSIRKRNPLKAP